MNTDPTPRAIELMADFAERTDITASADHTRVRARGAGRYLWTDAFAVVNFLALERVTHEPRYRRLALALVERVHDELAHHRPDDARTGWLSGLPPDEGAAHPTRGGLRIGKPLPEHVADKPSDPDIEWERDGQYFHYLTKWAHALDQVSRATGRGAYHVWARELMHTAHRAFAYGPPGHRRLAWKLSIDLSRSLVPTMGQHDPLDGFVTCTQLDTTAFDLQMPSVPNLGLATADFAGMLTRDSFVTTDPLGLGGLLIDACRLVQVAPDAHDLIAAVLGAAATGLHEYVTEPDLGAPADRRLAFRELGLAVGLAGVSMLEEEVWMDRLDVRGRVGVAKLARYIPLRAEIQSFWMTPAHRRGETWSEYQDINDVMLATSIVPDGLLVLGSKPTRTAADMLGTSFAQERAPRSNGRPTFGR